MSRAFVKEDGPDNEPLPDLPISPHPNYVTPRGLAALRSGAGLVTLFTRAEHAAHLNLTQPELMVRSAENLPDLKPLRETASVVALGPGLGQSEWAEAVFRECLGYPPPMVVDADGLRLLARFPSRRKNWILTPHPGEAADLLGITSKDVQKNRFQAVRAIQKK